MNIANKLGINLDYGPVKINSDKLTLLQNTIKLKSSQPTTWENDNYWPNKKMGRETVSQFFTIGNSINFKYWEKNGKSIRYCHGKKGGNNERGALYMWRSLKLCLDNNSYDILDAKELAKIELADFKKIFEDDDGNDVLPDLNERLANWKDLGQKLEQYWNGKTISIIEKSSNSIIQFVKFLREFRAFDDPLCKMIMVNALMHQERGIVKFNELMMPGIDYQIVKQLLRQGIIIPEEKTVNKLCNYQILTNEEALQLRKASLFALMKIVDDTGIGGHIVDNLIWLNRNNCEDGKPVCKIPGKERECPFLDFCDKRIEILIPLEETRYY